MLDEKDVMIPTRHGLRIAARVYRPDGPGPFPTLFAASPYRYDNDELPATSLFPWQETGPIRWYVERGYAYVRVDVLGTGRSEGKFSLLDPHEAEANYDAIEWVAAQPWSNGKVGGFGQSYYCMSQWRTAVLKPPSLTCIGAYDGLVDPYFYFAHSGGIESFYLPFWYAVALLPANRWPANGASSRFVPPDFLAEALQHPTYDEYWRARTALEELENIEIPVFSIGVWAKHELHCDGNIRGFQRSRGPSKLFVTGAPSVARAHTDFADVALHEDLLLPFYDHYLKGHETSYCIRPKVTVALRNSDLMLEADAWPPTGSCEQTLFLSREAQGGPNSLNRGGLRTEAGDEGSTCYVYPHPAWSIAFGTSKLDMTGFDHSGTVLTFTSDPLETEFDLTGQAKLVIYAASTATDMDMIVKLVDYPSDGSSPTIVTRGWFRASFRRRRWHDDPFSPRDFSSPEPIVPGEVYEFEIPLEQMAYRFRTGSRLGIEIANHDSPVRDRQFAHLYRGDKRGEDTIHYGRAMPSRLILQGARAPRMAASSLQGALTGG